jgi:hypothetical protein
MREVFKKTPELKLLMTLPGVGEILGLVILLEVGDVHRVPDAEHLAAYAGTTPRVGATGGKTRFGRLRPDVNHYLKWAYAEAANAICQHRKHWPGRHVSRLYERVCHRKNRAKAIGAVARHLAEAMYWILSKPEPYHEPKRRPGASTWLRWWQHLKGGWSKRGRALTREASDITGSPREVHWWVRVWRMVRRDKPGPMRGGEDPLKVGNRAQQVGILPDQRLGACPSNGIHGVD